MNDLKERREHTLNDEIPIDDIHRAFKITQKVPKCVYNRYVQFKILHNRLNTRNLLHKMRILNTNECVYCKNQIDTVIHALLECPETTNLWRQVELRLREQVEQSIKISDKEKIFGTTEKNQYTFQMYTCSFLLPNYLYIKNNQMF